jgi:hypothetical protein
MNNENLTRADVAALTQDRYAARMARKLANRARYIRQYWRRYRRGA